MVLSSDTTLDSKSLGIGTFELRLLCFSIILILFSQKSPFQFFDLDRFEWDKTRFNFRLRRLKKYSKYEIVVQAVNSHGEGPLSDIMVGQTKEAGNLAYQFD